MRAWLIAALLIVAADALAFERQRGVFVLDQNTAAPSTTLLSRPFVDGFIVRMPWTQVETGPGQYDFSELNAAVARLIQVNESLGVSKRLVVQILSSRAPAHVVALPGAVTYTAADRLPTNACPVGTTPPCFEQFLTVAPWDAGGRAAMDALLQALGSHPLPLDSAGSATISLRDHPLFYSIMVPVPGGRGVREMCTGTLVTSGLCQPLSSLPTWSVSAYAAAIDASVSAVRRELPVQFRYLEFFNFRVGSGGSAIDVAAQVLEALRPLHLTGPQPALGFFRENLSCSQPAPDAFPLAQEQVNTYNNLQMLDSWVNSFTGSSALAECSVVDGAGVLQSGPEVAIRYGRTTFAAEYFEIYTADANHEPLFDDFAAVHAEIHGSAALFTDGWE